MSFGRRRNVLPASPAVVGSAAPTKSFDATRVIENAIGSAEHVVVPLDLKKLLAVADDGILEQVASARAQYAGPPPLGFE